ncbi:hypothetical protein BEWA_033990 [Theileria equi strain WA]|uniref:Uncharacterized protein n=1 Tax=Theileria equi strain WA TaxID=1537102 RepID=L0AY84_THEEQ|nr:hypothetical protein BEWA_033990 [Theileria equi strain WA]AFZ80542.1 hypothetical protein BEWA_033990 [Theileria equi strain WA]|eukprot:XP_004830208.1 hypothetical protein BEWA_033990 [Theileria equi strain WA]
MTVASECKLDSVTHPINSGDLVKQTIDELRKQKISTEDVAEFDIKPIMDLFTRISEEIALNQPKNIVQFIVDFLCKNYPDHLHGFSNIWNSDPELEHSRIVVIEFFKHNKLPVEIASHFTRAGFDTLDAIASLNKESLPDIEKYSDAEWLPGHKIRLLRLFENIEEHISEFKRERPFNAVQKVGNP